MQRVSLKKTDLQETGIVLMVTCHFYSTPFLQSCEWESTALLRLHAAASATSVKMKQAEITFFCQQNSATWQCSREARTIEEDHDKSIKWLRDKQSLLHVCCESSQNERFSIWHWEQQHNSSTTSMLDFEKTVHWHGWQRWYIDCGTLIFKHVLKEGTCWKPRFNAGVSRNFGVRTVNWYNFPNIILNPNLFSIANFTFDSFWSLDFLHIICNESQECVHASNQELVLLRMWWLPTERWICSLKHREPGLEYTVVRSFSKHWILF